MRRWLKVRSIVDSVIKRSLWLLVLSTALVLAAVLAGQPGTPHEAVGHPVTSGQPGAERAAAEPGHLAHAEIASEADFIAGMIPHHQEAVESARQVLAATERAEMRDLAQAVIAAQTAEIATLRGWLAAWYPQAQPSAYEPMMPDLLPLSPDEADRAFLEGMIAHHDMAIAMAQDYLAGDFEKRPEVVALAEEITSVQEEENAQMRAWLEAWYGEDAGHDQH
jgi:uncharacterized protein (DUF305 family)